MAIIFAVIAVITLANPDISVLDFLPDVIGCLLLYFALATPSEFSNKLSEARTLLFKLTVLTAADAVVTYFISSDDATMILLMSFCFGTAEAAMLYVLVDKIFDGMIYLGTRFPATGIYMPEREKKLLRYRRKLERKFDRYAERSALKGTVIPTEKIRERIDALVSKKSDKSLAKLIRLTKQFIVVKAILNILPEFTALSSYGYEGEVHSYDVNIADFRGLFIVFAVFFTSIFAIVWLLSVLRYINAIRRDTPFREALRAAYSSDVVANTGLVRYKRMKLAMTLLSVGVFLSIDFMIDQVNFVPDVLSAAAILLFWLTFVGESKKPVLGISVTVLYGAVSFAHWMAVRDFIENYYSFTRTVKSDEAMTAYIVCCILSFAAEALFVGVMFLTTRKLDRVIHSDTGYISTGGEYDTYSEKLHNKLSKQNKGAFAFSVIMALTSLAYSIIVGINKPVEAMQDGVKYVFYVPVFEGIASLMLIVSVVYIIYTVKHVSDVSDGLDERYKLT